MGAVVLIVMVVCAVLGWVIGEPKGRGGLGVLLGALLGLIGLVIIAVLEPLPGSSRAAAGAGSPYGGRGPLPLVQSFTSGSLSEELKELQSLRDEGLLSDEEFQGAKRRLLGL